MFSVTIAKQLNAKEAIALVLGMLLSAWVPTRLSKGFHVFCHHCKTIKCKGSYSLGLGSWDALGMLLSAWVPARL
jgi:hypothetical protein